MAMWAGTYANFESLFPKEFAPGAPRSDANALFLGVACFVMDDPLVECVIHRFDINHELQATAFVPEHGEFGRPLKNAAGEDVWLRTRSFLERSPLPNRAFESMIPGEIREIVVVVGSRDVANVAIVRAWTRGPKRSADKATPAAAPVVARREENETTHVTYGCGVFPFVFPEGHSSKRKSKTIRLGGYNVVFCGCADVRNGSKDGFDCIKRNTSLFAFAEWILECRQLRYPKEGPFSITYEKGEYEAQFERFVANAVEREKQWATGHENADDDDLPAQSVKTMPAAISMAHCYSEFVSLTAIVDLIASHTLNGIPNRLVSHPHFFHLYAAVAIVVAANPQYFFAPELMSKYAEDAFLIDKLFSQYQSLHKQTTALELMVHDACNQSAQFLARKRAQRRAGKGGGGSATEPLHSTVPIGVEFMRRQALTLAHELFARPREATRRERLDQATAFFPPTVVADATENLTSSVESAMDAETAAKGYGGSDRQTVPRSLRTASRDGLARIALQILLDVNEYLTTGVFKMVNMTVDSEVVPIVESGIEVHVNLQAWADTKRVVNMYFCNGAMLLVDKCDFLTFPVRPRTRARCGGCLERFSPIEMAAAHLCWRCRAPMCASCSKRATSTFCNACASSREPQPSSPAEGG